MADFFIYRTMAKNRGDRAAALGEYIVRTGATVRAAAEVFGMAKSTVHKYVTDGLAAIDPALAAEVRCVLERNLAERHLRGGEATRRKFLHADETGKVS